jgi:hypothetical protein
MVANRNKAPIVPPTIGRYVWGSKTGSSNVREYENAIKRLGWVWSPPFQWGGWIHPDHTNDDGKPLAYNDAEEVCRAYGIEVDDDAHQ